MEDRNKYIGIGTTPLQQFGNLSVDLLKKYGIGELNRAINNIEVEDDSPEPNKASVAKKYIRYRSLISDELRNKVSEADSKILAESMTIYSWGDAIDNPDTNDTQVLFAPMSFYSLSRNKITNIQNLPSTNTSLKEYYSTDDYNIQAQCLFYTHLRDIVPSDFIRRFGEMMEYTGLVKVDNPFLNRFGVNFIYITDFNVIQSNILNNQTVAFTALSENYNQI